MTLSALQDVPADTPASPAASRIATVVLDTTTSLGEAFELTAAHLLVLPRVEAVTAALTTFAPDDTTGWSHLGERAWVTEWLKPGTRCSALPGGDFGPDAALSLPWVSQRARDGALTIVDVDLLPDDADQDRRELTSCGIRGMVTGPFVANGLMYGSLAMGGTAVGAWPEHHVADFRLLNAALTARIALEQSRRSLAESVAVGATTRETQQHFLASVGHELRTPLTAILGYTEMLVEEAGEHAGDEFADAVSRDGQVILRAGEQLMAVLEDLLSAGRAVGDGGPREHVEVEAAVADVLHWHRAAARAVDVHLENAVEPGRTVWAHSAGLRQVLVNLVGNAIVHNVRGGSVSVSTASFTGEAGEGRLRVIVRDTGPGLTAEQLNHVFEPFVRYAQPSVKGTGLGLSLSRSIAERDGGTIGVESTPGSGTAFWIELPADAAKQPA